MKKFSKMLLAGLASVIAFVCTVVGFGNISIPTVTANAESNLKNLYEFKREDTFATLGSGDILSSVSYVLSFNEDEIPDDQGGAAHLNLVFDYDKTDRADGFKKRPNYLYRFRFYDNDLGITLASYTYFYTYSKIFVFADVYDNSSTNSLELYTVSTFDLNWQATGKDKNNYNYLKNTLSDNGSRYDNDWDFYCEIEQDSEDRKTNPFVDGELLLEMNDLTFDRKVSVDFTFGYYAWSVAASSWNIFGGYKAVDLPCTGRVYSSNKTTLQSELDEYVSVDGYVVRQEQLISKFEKNKLSVWQNKVNDYIGKTGNISETVCVGFLYNIPGTPFAERRFIDVQVQKAGLSTGLYSLVVLDAFKEEIKKHVDIPYAVLSSTPEYATLVTNEYFYDLNGNYGCFDISPERSFKGKSYDGVSNYVVDSSYYMIGYKGDVAVELTTKSGAKSYMGLSLNRSYADYFNDPSTQKLKSEFISIFNGSSLDFGDALWNKLTLAYKSILDEYNPSMRDLYGYWGFSAVPNDGVLMSSSINLFNDRRMNISSALVGTSFNKVSIKNADYKKLMSSFGYTNFSSFLFNSFNLLTGRKSTVNLAVFYATTLEEAVVSYNGSLNWGDDNPLWVNTIQDMAHELAVSKIAKDFGAALTIAMFGIAIALIVIVAIYIASFFKMMTPDEYGFGAVTYNWDQSINTSNQDSHDTSTSYDTYHNKNKTESTHGHTYNYSSGDRFDYSNRDTTAYNSSTSGDTFVKRDGANIDMSKRTSNNMNTSRSGDTHVNREGSNIDMSKRSTVNYAQSNSGDTHVRRTGHNYDNSLKNTRVFNNSHVYDDGVEID